MSVTEYDNAFRIIVDELMRASAEEPLVTVAQFIRKPTVYHCIEVVTATDLEDEP